MAKETSRTVLGNWALSSASRPGTCGLYEMERVRYGRRGIKKEKRRKENAGKQKP
jgi:hypothetical protein